MPLPKGSIRENELSPSLWFYLTWNRSLEKNTKKEPSGLNVRQIVLVTYADDTIALANVEVDSLKGTANNLIDVAKKRDFMTQNFI